MDIQEKRMGALRIMEALSGVDEELLARSEQENRILGTSRVWRRGGMAVACLCVLVAGLGAYRLQQSQNASDTTAAMALATVTDLAEEVMMAEEAAPADAKKEGVEAGMDQNLQEGQKNDLKNGQGTGNGGAIEEADAGSGYQEGSDNLETEVSQSKPLETMKKLETESDAYAQVLGEYLPTKLPAGYVYKDGNLSEDENSILVSWTKGMDYITISVRRMERNQIVLTDISKSETYDVNLYEIPYADTVPEAYHEIFDNPIFARDQLSLELVQSRMKVVADSGDTGTPRGDFSLWYEEGILVEWTGRGTAESIFEMLSTLP